MTEFIKVDKNDIKLLASIASEIWNDFWGIILSPAQIDYMIEKFQSERAINNQIDYENYIYYFIKEDVENAGYFGISIKNNYLFLSKLYIKADFRSKGLGRKSFEKIKDIARNYNLNSIQLTVNKYNENTIAAYKKWGFKTIDSVVTDIGNGFVMDDYIMEFRL